MVTRGLADQCRVATRGSNRAVALCCVGSRRLLTPVECMGTLIAALCHDLEHPGTNNLYQVTHCHVTLWTA